MSELVRFGVSLEKSLLDRFDLLCLEIVAARGKAEEVRKLADALRSIKGVRHATLSMSSTGREIELRYYFFRLSCYE